MKFLSYLRVMTLSQRLMPILLLALMTNTVAAAAAEQALATNCLTLPELRKKWEGPPLAQVIQAAEQGSADAMTHFMSGLSASLCRTFGRDDLILVPSPAARITTASFFTITFK